MVGTFPIDLFSATQFQHQPNTAKQADYQIAAIAFSQIGAQYGKQSLQRNSSKFKQRTIGIGALLFYEFCRPSSHVPTLIV